MSETIDSVSQSDFEMVKSWLKENEKDCPEAIRNVLEGILANYLKILAKDSRNQKGLLRELRMAMGLIPKSEKGTSENKFFRG